LFKEPSPQHSPSVGYTVPASSIFCSHLPSDILFFFFPSATMIWGSPAGIGRQVDSRIPWFSFPCFFVRLYECGETLPSLTLTMLTRYPTFSVQPKALGETFSPSRIRHSPRPCTRTPGPRDPDPALAPRYLQLFAATLYFSHSMLYATMAKFETLFCLSFLPDSLSLKIFPCEDSIVHA